MSQYAKSNYIHILPINIFRSLQESGEYSVFPDGQSLSELNLRTLVRSLSSTPRYIVDAKKDNNVLKSLTFVYDGAVIKVTDGDILKSYPLYVNVKTITNSEALYDIKSFDPEFHKDVVNNNAKEFTGVEFTNSASSDYFQLLDDNGNIPEKSWLRFDQKALFLQSIDGGEV